LAQRTLYASISRDNGENWTIPVKTKLSEATSRAFAGNLPDGTAYIISNPNQNPNPIHPSIGIRSPLTIALSNDGTVFDKAYVIRSEPTTRRFEGNHKLAGYQYPAAVVWQGHLYIAYSINKEDVAVARIAMRDLLEGNVAGGEG